MENTLSQADAKALSKTAHDYLRAAVVAIADATGDFGSASVLFTWQGKDYKVSLSKES